MIQGYVTADAIADEFLTDTYDESGVHRERVLRWMFRTWIEITRNFFNTSRYVLVSIDPYTKTARIPPDSKGVQMLGRIDAHKNFIPFNMNRNLLPTLNIEDQTKKHHCDKCNAPDLCGMIQLTVVNELAFVIDNREYYRTISQIFTPGGRYYEEIKQPYISDAKGEVNAIKYEITQNDLCKLEPLGCGCIPATDINIRNLRNCGCLSVFTCVSNDMLPYPVNEDWAGTYNIYNKEGYVQFSPDCGITSCLMIYESVGLCKDNVFYFPLQAQEAIIEGTYAKSIAKKPNVPVNAKLYADRKYGGQLKSLFREETKLPVEEIKQIFFSIPRIPTLE